VEVDRHMIYDTGGERIAEYFALLDEGDIMFSDEVVCHGQSGCSVFGKRCRVGGWEEGQENGH